MKIKNKNLFIVILLSLFPSFIFGQESIYRDITYDQTLYTSQRYFPALYNNNNKYTSFLVNKFYTGALSPIKSFYFNGGVIIGKNQHLHFIMNNYLEGEFFNKSRFYLNYSYEINLSRKRKIGLGISPGLVHYNFKGSLSSAGGSSTVFDLNLNTYYISQTLRAGISYNQIPQGVLKPIAYSYKLNNSFLFYIDKSFSLNQITKINTIILYEKFKQEQFTELGFFLDLYSQIKLGYFYNIKKNMSIQAGVYDIKYKNTLFSVLLSYNFPSLNFGKFASNSTEITLGLKSLRNSSHFN